MIVDRSGAAGRGIRFFINLFGGGGEGGRDEAAFGVAGMIIVRDSKKYLTAQGRQFLFEGFIKFFHLYCHIIVSAVTMSKTLPIGSKLDCVP